MSSQIKKGDRNSQNSHTFSVFVEKGILVRCIIVIAHGCRKNRSIQLHLLADMVANKIT